MSVKLLLPEHSDRPFWVLVEVAAMSHLCWLRTAAVCALFLPLAIVRAEELPSSSNVAIEPTGDDVARLIEQLDESEFAERQAASRKLGELGTTALPHLERIIATGSREASARAMSLLKQQFQDGGGASKMAATESLQRLASSKQSSVAQRARNVLSPPKEPTWSPMFGGMFPRGGGRGFPGPLPPGNGFTRTVTTHEANGRREVEVKENDSTIKMQTLPSGRIEVEITQTRQGKDVTERFSAKDLEELRGKNAEAGKIYEQYQPSRLRGVARLPDGVRKPFWGSGR